MRLVFESCFKHFFVSSLSLYPPSPPPPSSSSSSSWLAVGVRAAQGAPAAPTARLPARGRPPGQRRCSPPLAAPVRLQVQPPPHTRKIRAHLPCPFNGYGPAASSHCWLVKRFGVGVWLHFTPVGRGPFGILLQVLVSLFAHLLLTFCSTLAPPLPPF